MATPLGILSYHTDEEMVAQSDTKLLGSTVESLVVEFDQERYEKFLSSKSTRRFRKVSRETTQALSLSLSLCKEESSDEDRLESFKKIHRSSPMAMPKESSKLVIRFADGYTLQAGGPSQSRQAKKNMDRRQRRKARRLEEALRREAMEKMEESLHLQEHDAHEDKLVTAKREGHSCSHEVKRKPQNFEVKR
jgi:hypothetical protein